MITAPGDISIVVPVGGAAVGWPRAAASLARMDPPPGEIIVVLDGSNDAHAEAAAAAGATVLSLTTRGGPARARNRGAEIARGDILLFLDADVEVPGDLAGAVAELFSAAPELTAVMGSYDAAPAAPGLVSQYRNLLHHYVHQTGRPQASTFWAGCGAIRRRAFLEAGGFDERFDEPSIEDVELGARLSADGHAIRLDRALQVKHLKQWRLFDLVHNDLWRRAVPWSELMLRDGRIVNDLNVKTRDRASVLLGFTIPLALLASWRSPRYLAAAAAAAAGVVGLNAGFFRFLAGQRGVLFAARSVPLYWLYLMVCGTGFGIGLARHWTRGRSDPRASGSVARPPGGLD
jgi:glycosyltransferase involved in cell wall biosynthesis